MNGELKAVECDVVWVVREAGRDRQYEREKEEDDSILEEADERSLMALNGSRKTGE